MTHNRLVGGSSTFGRTTFIMHSPPHFIALFVTAFLGCCMVGSWAPRLEAEGWKFWKRSKTEPSTLSQGSSLPVEDVSAQEAEKQRVQNEKTLQKEQRAQRRAEEKRQSELTQESKKTQRQIRREQREVVSRQKKLVRSLSKNQQKVGRYQPADKPSFFRRLFSRKPKSDGFFIPSDK